MNVGILVQIKIDDVLLLCSIFALRNLIDVLLTNVWGPLLI